jgi:hypothetical protein
LEEKRPHKGTVRRASGGPPLTQYRLYFLHSVDHLISHSHEFEAESDDRAIQTAEAWREGRRAELWTGARKVKAWAADD